MPIGSGGAPGVTGQPTATPEIAGGGFPIPPDLLAKLAAGEFVANPGGKPVFPNPSIDNTASAGTATALPANPAGYIVVEIDGYNYKIDYYNM